MNKSPVSSCVYLLLDFTDELWLTVTPWIVDNCGFLLHLVLSQADGKDTHGLELLQVSACPHALVGDVFLKSTFNFPMSNWVLVNL